MVFDVRCLPNPYYEPDLAELTGLDQPVADFVFKNGHAQAMLAKITELMELTIPLFEADRRELTVAVGCTGGRHRSVAMAQALGQALEGRGLLVAVSHRDMNT